MFHQIRRIVIADILQNDRLLTGGDVGRHPLIDHGSGQILLAHFLDLLIADFLHEGCISFGFRHFSGCQGLFLCVREQVPCLIPAVFRIQPAGPCQVGFLFVPIGKSVRVYIEYIHDPVGIKLILLIGHALWGGIYKIVGHHGFCQHLPVAVIDLTSGRRIVLSDRCVIVPFLCILPIGKHLQPDQTCKKHSEQPQNDQGQGQDPLRDCFLCSAGSFFRHDFPPCCRSPVFCL